LITSPLDLTAKMTSPNSAIAPDIKAGEGEFLSLLEVVRSNLPDGPSVQAKLHASTARIEDPATAGLFENDGEAAIAPSTTRRDFASFGTSLPPSGQKLPPVTGSVADRDVDIWIEPVPIEMDKPAIDRPVGARDIELVTWTLPSDKVGSSGMTQTQSPALTSLLAPPTPQPVQIETGSVAAGADEARAAVRLADTSNTGERNTGDPSAGERVETARPIQSMPAANVPVARFEAAPAPVATPVPSALPGEVAPPSPTTSIRNGQTGSPQKRPSEPSIARPMVAQMRAAEPIGAQATTPATAPLEQAEQSSTQVRQGPPSVEAEQRRSNGPYMRDDAAATRRDNSMPEVPEAQTPRTQRHDGLRHALSSSVDVNAPAATSGAARQAVQAAQSSPAEIPPTAPSRKAQASKVAGPDALPDRLRAISSPLAVANGSKAVRVAEPKRPIERTKALEPGQGVPTVKEPTDKRSAAAPDLQTAPAQPQHSAPSIAPSTQAPSVAPIAATPPTSPVSPAVASATEAATRADGGAQIESAINQLTQARETARKARPELTVRNQDFGAVRMQIETAGADLRATIANRDPAFVPAVQAALVERAMGLVSETGSNVSQRGADMTNNSQSGQNSAAGQHAQSDGRYGSSTGSGQGSSQPYREQTGSRDDNASANGSQRPAQSGDQDPAGGDVFA